MTPPRWWALGAGLVGAAILALLALRRPAPLAPPSPLAPMSRPTTAPAPASPARLPARADAEPLARASWGTAPGQFGRKRNAESNPEAPMAVTCGAPGELAIVDQVNARVQRFSSGRWSGAFAISDTVQDIAIGWDGATVLLDRLAKRNVEIRDAAGRAVRELPLVGRGVPEGASATGIFVTSEGMYVEREHGAAVRIADRYGVADPERPEFAGRPTRDARMFIRAAIADRARGALTVSAFDAGSAPLWARDIELGAPILHVLMLDSDRRGRVYVAAAIGRESSEPPYRVANESIVVARLDSNGAPSGVLSIPPMPGADETFRPLTVDDDGAVYAIYPTEESLDVVRFSFGS